MVNDVIQTRPEGPTCVEESPFKSSGSNVHVERGVQSMEGQVRAMLFALEGRLGRNLSAREVIVNFMQEYAAYFLNGKNGGQDGKTAY